MKRRGMKRLLAIVIGLAAIAPGLAIAQSNQTPTLVDVAKAEEARRKGVRKPAKVYTNDNLKSDFSVGVRPGSGHARGIGRGRKQLEHDRARHQHSRRACAGHARRARNARPGVLERQDHGRARGDRSLALVCRLAADAASTHSRPTS